jgi:hypothetical protein
MEGVRPVKAMSEFGSQLAKSGAIGPLLALHLGVVFCNRSRTLKPAQPSHRAHNAAASTAFHPRS